MTTTMQFRTLPKACDKTYFKAADDEDGYSQTKNSDEPKALELIISLASLVKKLDNLAADLEYLHSVVDRQTA